MKILDQAGKEVPQGSEAEICICGENVMKGYLSNPEANKSSFTAEGFFRTGDQGKQDKDGYVVITGRIKELINRGGEKISPIEIDNVVAQHPNVAEAVSFAIEDEMYGQDIGLAVVLNDGKNVGEDDLRKWVAEKVAKFKVLKKVGLSTREEEEIMLIVRIDFLHRCNAKDCNGEGAEEDGSRGDVEEGNEGEVVEVDP